MKKLLAAAIMTLSFSAIAHADISAKALELVPGGTIHNVKYSKVDVKTANGSIVEIDFTLRGEFKEASGELIEQDNFVPDNGHKSLADVVTALKDQGYVLKGEWSYDRTLKGPWHYEVEALLNGTEYEVVLDGHSGSIIETERD